MEKKRIFNVYIFLGFLPIFITSVSNALAIIVGDYWGNIYVMYLYIAVSLAWTLYTLINYKIILEVSPDISILMLTIFSNYSPPLFFFLRFFVFINQQNVISIMLYVLIVMIFIFSIIVFLYRKNRSENKSAGILKKLE